MLLYAFDDLGGPGPHVFCAKTGSVQDSFRMKFQPPHSKTQRDKGIGGGIEELLPRCSVFWMMSLKDKNRALASLWDFRNKPFNSITAIVATLRPASISSGYVTVGYEFAGFEQYADSKTAKQNDSY
jgi:hypothetical protein